ncbi:MAG TPA: DUF2203 domain-containing protein [Pyrinomonadaceae bacterium]|nr:DUF2203 domain-containing protein [Pyrinomonadaceae bacterium]
MKLFSVEEANALLPTARRILGGLRRSYARVTSMRDDAVRASEGSKAGGGGMARGPDYIAALARLAESAAEIDALGIQLKDYERGLIDFPSMRDGRVVLLCWQLGEGDRIEWWHDMEAGFAGRQPL